MPLARTLPILVVSVLAAASASAAAATASTDYIWVEGEAAASSNLKPHNWYSGAVKKELLSGDDFLSTFDGPAEAVASWNVEVAAAGSYALWLRLNPIQAKAQWRLDGGTWSEVDFAQATDSQNLAADGKPDLRFLAWIKAGQVQLKAGKAVLELRFTSALNRHGAIDCLVFAAKPFTPNGRRKPGATLSDAEPGWFAFDAPADGFATAALDLRGLNEKRAGDKGWVTAKGDDFALGDGTPVRFWAANAGPADNAEAAAYLAGRLAKTGVNLARLHGAVCDREAADPTAISAARLDRIHAQVKANADCGIYTHLSTYFPLWLQLKPGDGIEGGALGKNTFVLLQSEPRFQQLYKAWAKQVLTTKNPYTGKTLAEDPAVAMWEVQNEDSFLFWTFSPENVGRGPWSRLEQRFAAALAARPGGLAKARTAWAGERHPDDDEAAGHVGLYGAWEMTGDGYAKSGPGKQARIRDQVRFLAEAQRGFYADMVKFLRGECGFKGVITASNWTTADNRQLLAIERWTYTATDAIDRHGYFGGRHEGDSAAWSVRAGQSYEDRAAVLDPAEALVGYAQIAGRPHLHSEVMWSSPNRFVADGPLLLASYGALQGVDGWVSFATHGGNWSTDGANKWPMMSPGWLGQFPAAALQFRRGDVKPATAVVRQVSTVDQLFDRSSGGFVEGPNADFRTADAPKASSAGALSAFDPLTYCVGRVERVIAGLPGAPAGARPLATDLGRSIDRTARTAASATGELRWDWGRGVVTVDTPRSQAATGFLAKAGDLRLGDVTIRSRNEYGTVWLISLDGLPLATSKRMLVQAFTEQRLYGWRAEGGRIQDVGRAPWNVREIDATLVLKGAAAATVLDGHGYPVGAPAAAAGTIVLPKNAIYVLLTR